MKLISNRLVVLGLVFHISRCVMGQIHLTGILLDKETDEPIAFATVGILNSGVGTVSNLDGHFKLMLDDSLSTASIHFSTVGYKARTIPLNDLLSGSVVYLEEELITLQGITVEAEKLGRSRVKSMYVGNREYNTGTMRMDVNYNGGAMALLIEHDNFPVKVMSARLRIRFNSLPSFKVRVRILEVNAAQEPGKDLLPEDVIITSDISRGWLRVDLSAYNLWVEEPRFFLAFEWVMDEESRQTLRDQFLAHLQEDPTSLSENIIKIDGEEVKEKTIADFKNGVWFGSLIHPVYSGKYECFYRVNGLNPWQPSAAILAAEVSILDYKLSESNKDRTW